MTQEPAELAEANAGSSRPAADGDDAEAAEMGMGLFNEEQAANWDGPQPAVPSRDQPPQMWGNYGSSAKSQRVKTGSGEAVRPPTSNLCPCINQAVPC